MAPKFDDYAAKMDTLYKVDSVWSKIFTMLGKQVVIWKPQGDNLEVSTTTLKCQYVLSKSVQYLKVPVIIWISIIFAFFFRNVKGI